MTFAPKEARHTFGVRAGRANAGGTALLIKVIPGLNVPADGTSYRLLNGDFGTSPSSW